MQGSERRLYKSRDRMVAGVLGGIAEYLGVDPTLVRLAFAAVLVAEPAAAALFYVLAAIIMPERPGPSPPPRIRPGREALVAGLVLVALGAYMAAGEQLGVLVHPGLRALAGVVVAVIGVLIIASRYLSRGDEAG